MNKYYYDILVSLWQDGDGFAKLSTYSRANGGHGKFLIDTNMIKDWYKNGGIGTLYDHDHDNIMMLYSTFGNNFLLRVYWLKKCGKTGIQGCVQTIKLTDGQMNMLVSGNSLRFVSRMEKKKVHIDTRYAKWGLRDIQSDKLSKRAFVKAIRQYLSKGEDEKVTLFDDWIGYRSLTFLTDPYLLTGGRLVRNSTTINTKHGVYPKVSYNFEYDSH